MRHMHVYLGSKDPIVIESNLAWAIPYWKGRKHLNPRITWRFT